MLLYTTDYFDSGFLTFQQAIDIAIIEYHMPPTSELQRDNLIISLQRHPYPDYLDDGFIFILQGQFPLFLMLSYMCTAPIIVKDVVLEKERKLKVFVFKHLISTNISCKKIEICASLVLNTTGCTGPPGFHVIIPREKGILFSFFCLSGTLFFFFFCVRTTTIFLQFSSHTNKTYTI